MDLEERVFYLETKVTYLLDVIKTLTGDKLVYGTKRSWTDEQHKFLREQWNLLHDHNKICEVHNEFWGPQGYVERTPTAIACQLYKIIDHKALSRQVVTIAEKYIKE